MKLPNGQRAYVGISKLTNYALNPVHDLGKHKARVFASVLGLARKDAKKLRTALLEAAQHAQAKKAAKTNFGQLYSLDFYMTTDKGNARLRSGWIILNNEDYPRLTSVYIITNS